MGLQMTKISDGLHLLHIINPEVSEHDLIDINVNANNYIGVL